MRTSLSNRTLVLRQISGGEAGSGAHRTPSLTQDYAKGLVAAPEDREPAVKKLVESVGAKLINFYFTTGDSDFLIIT
jgi:GYD domain